MPAPRKPRGFIEHEMSEDAFLKLSYEKRDIIQRYSIPLEADKGRRRFKMTKQWMDQVFPGKG